MIERLADWYTGLPDTYLLGAICVMLFMVSVPWWVTAWIVGALIAAYIMLWPRQM